MLAKCYSELGDGADGAAQRGEIAHLRPDMYGEASGEQPFSVVLAVHASIEFGDGIDRDAEFVFCAAGTDLFDGVGSDIRIHPQSHPSRCLEGLGTGTNGGDFFDRLGVDLADP